jgi:Uma2 family endonuclease
MGSTPQPSELPEALPDGTPMTLAQYLAFEAGARERHEFVDGRVYAMVGGTFTHHRLVANVYRLLDAAALGGPCFVFRESFRLRVGEDHYYPDLMVVCGEPLAGDAIVAERPCLLVEVLSPSTARTDHTQKRDAYRRIPSLEAYLRVHAARRDVECERRGRRGRWRTEHAIGQGTLRLPCLPVVLDLDAVYAGLDVPTVPPLRRLKEPANGAYGHPDAGLSSPA